MAPDRQGRQQDADRGVSQAAGPLQAPLRSRQRGEGTLQWDNASGATRLYRVSTESWETFALPAGFDRNDLFLAELRHFMAVTRGEVEPLCPLEVGERVVRLTQAAHRSAESGQRMRL